MAVLLGLVGVMALAAGPARAVTFESLCPGGSYDVALQFASGRLRFLGSVSCTGGSIAIESVNLLKHAPPGVWAGAPKKSCSSSCSTSATAPADPGVYSVQMSFSVTKGGFTAWGLPGRSWAYVTGQPTPLPVSLVGCLVEVYAGSYGVCI